jgi:dUTP pyrophosphatase
MAKNKAPKDIKEEVLPVETPVEEAQVYVTQASVQGYVVEPAADNSNWPVVKALHTSRYELPAYKSALASGMDLHANIQSVIKLRPLQRALIPTGLALELPASLEAQVRPRSGLAHSAGLSVLNAPGTIDADYRGEIKVNLVNLSDTPVVIAPGERIAQLVFAPVVRVRLEERQELSQTVRGEEGHGSSGK